MVRNIWLRLALTAAAVLCGCSGELQLDVPDQIAPRGGATSTVMRLRHNEFAGLMMPVKGAPMQMRVEDGPLVGAFTDPKGYAAANVPVGDRMGLYHMTVAMQDSHGRELRQFAPVYAWDARMSVVAVEYEAVEGRGTSPRSARR